MNFEFNSFYNYGLFLIVYESWANLLAGYFRAKQIIINLVTLNLVRSCRFFLFHPVNKT